MLKIYFLLKNKIILILFAYMEKEKEEEVFTDEDYD